MTSSCSSSSSTVSLVVLEDFAFFSFFVFAGFVDLSLISSQNTPGGIARHCDPMFARISASSLLILLMWFTSQPSNNFSSSLYTSLYAIILSLTASHWFMTCCATNCESPKIFSRVAPQAFAIFIPCMRASYSASLLDAFGNVIRRTYFNLSPSGDSNITPAPAPSKLLDPSKFMVQVLDKSGGPVFCSSIHSAMKSGKTCDFIVFLFSYVMSRGESSIPQRETRPVASGLFSIFDKGASLTTIIGCAEK